MPTFSCCCSAVDPRILERARDRRRERQNRRGEDHRDDAAGVHLQRNVRARSAVHPPADHALGVLHRDAAVPALDEHDRRDDERHQHDQEQDADQADLPVPHLIERLQHGAREADDDARRR